MVRTQIQGASTKVQNVLRAEWKQGRKRKCQWLNNITIAAWVLLMVVV